MIAPTYAEDAAYRARFMREAALAALAAHPHVVTVYDANERDGRLYAAMQYVEGDDLRRRISVGGAMGQARAAEIARQIGSALDAAHHAGLVHRDVKPANILIADRDGEDHAFLSDFGVSRLLGEADQLTQPGSFIGAPHYAAPEQHQGGPVDGRADIYALGCVLFEMLTGQVPFRRTTPVGLALAHCTEPRPRPTELEPSVNPAFDAVIARAMAIDPSQRFQTAGELGAAAVAAAARTAGAETAAAGTAAAGTAVETTTHESAGAETGTGDDATLVQEIPASPPATVAPESAAVAQPPRVLRKPEPTPAQPRPTEPLTPQPARALPPTRSPEPGKRRRRARPLLVLLVLAAVVAAIVVVVVAGRGGGGTAATVAITANVRTGPSLQARRLPEQLKAGSHVRVSCWVDGTGAARGWVRLKSPNGGGYVAADLLRPVITKPRC